jgi:signal transduction histidine kinase/DNA-binding response OmpR family regulator
VSFRLASRWPLILAALFSTYSVVLLWDAFQSKEQLKAAADARLIADSKRRASALGDFAAELRSTTQGLAEVHEVRTYLINKALGMSPRYGLNANLDAIEQRFRSELDGRKLGEERFLRRIVLVDAQGERLADTDSEQGVPEAPPGAPRLPPAVPGGPSLAVDAGAGLITVAAPVVFKGETSGTVLTVVELSHLYRFLIHIEGEGTYRETFLGTDGREIQPPGEAHVFPPNLAARLLHLPEDRPVALSDLPEADREPSVAGSIAIKSAVAGMPLALLTTISADESYGRLNSPLFLYSLSLFPVLVLLAALRMDRLQLRANKLALRAARSDSRRQILQGQNTALAEEIRRREAVERELQHHQDHLEELVAQRTAELNSLFLALPDLYFRLKRDGTILDYRSGEDSDLYASPDVFLGKRMQDVLPAEASRLTSGALEQIAAGSEQCAFEYGLPMRSGHQFYEARVLPLGGEQVVVVVRNVTQRHMLEEARELNRQEAERLARVKSEFLANMSHEIRTPLNGILGMAQVGYRESEGRGKSLQAFSRIIESGKLLLRIINDILDFSKIEAGKLGLESVPVELHRVLHHACEVVDGRARAKGISLSSRLASDLPETCLGDPLRLEQVLLNLLSNAVKFTERGGVVVEASLDGGSLVFAVSDTGIGMAEAQLARLFTPFEQADGSTTRRFGGTGLGLAIVKRLVDLMDGTISVDSEPGQGSRFEVRMPYVAAARPRAAPQRPGVLPAIPAGGPRLAGLRLLVAEDAEINQLVLQELLTAEGAEVVTVGDGRQALERVADQGLAAFDLVLMDIQMPVMDGYEATRRLRELAPSLPVIGQTAHALAEERMRCLESGMVDHVAKPIDVEDLVVVVLRHAPTGERRQAPNPAVAQTPALAGVATVDWSGLEARFSGRPGFGAKLAATLMESQGDTPGKLRKAIDACDVEAIAFLAHKLRGMAGNLSLPGLQHLAGEAESAARQRSSDAALKAQALLAPLEHLLSQTGDFLAGRGQVEVREQGVENIC